MNNRKRIIWNIVSLLLAILTIRLVLMQDKGFSFREFKEFFLSSDPLFLSLAAVSSCGYFFFEGLAVTRMARLLGYTNKRFGTIYGAADVYFSAITPSATGGQPASAYFMIKDGIPAFATTAILLANLIMYAISMLLVGAISLFTHLKLFSHYQLLSRGLIIFGVFLMTMLTLVFYMLLRHGTMLFKICRKVIRLLEKLRLTRHGNQYQEKLVLLMKEYHECSELIFGHKRILIETFFWNMMQRLSQVTVSFFVYLAAGYGIATAKAAWHIQNLTMLGANCIPVPGAMGVADYLMLDGYSVLLGSDETAVQMELLSRSFSFYACIITSAVIVVIGYLNRKRKKKAK